MKKEHPWPGFRPHETEVTAAAACLERQSFSGGHHLCETRHLVAPTLSPLGHHGQSAISAHRQTLRCVRKWKSDPHVELN